MKNTQPLTQTAAFSVQTAGKNKKSEEKTAGKKLSQNSFNITKNTTEWTIQATKLQTQVNITTLNKKVPTTNTTNR